MICHAWAPDLTVYQGDVREILKALPNESVQCIVTSPPYWGLRDYGTAQWVGGSQECDHKPSSTPEKRGIASSTLGGGKANSGHQQEGYKGECRKCGARRIDSQLGLEPTPEEYVANLVDVFREVRRALRKDGTLWLNLGDSYSGSGVNNGTVNPGLSKAAQRGDVAHTSRPNTRVPGLKPKDMIGIPWRVAFALQADGWYLRSDIIWHKPNPMPESVTDRPTKAHEYMFLLTLSGTPQFWTHPRKCGTRTAPAPDHIWRHRKSGVILPYPPVSGRLLKRFWVRLNLWQAHDYYYDAEAIKEPMAAVADSTADDIARAFNRKREANLETRADSIPRQAAKPPASATFKRNGSKRALVIPGQTAGTHRPERNHTWPTGFRNKRTVWKIATQPFPGAHFATFPKKLAEPCILAGSAPKACSVCGAPWWRVLGEEQPGAGRSSGNKERKIATQGQMSRRNTHQGYAFPWSPTIQSTVGWRPTCNCKGHDGAGKSVALDPFAGSMTTGDVALSLGRAGIMCELNPAYVEIGRRRILRTQTQLSL